MPGVELFCQFRELDLPLEHVDLWLGCPRCIHDRARDSWERLLSPDELATYQQRRDPADRVAYLLAHGMLRLALSSYAPAIQPHRWTFETAAHGKPQLKGPIDLHIQFSISHSRQISACAVTRHEIGVDVEGDRIPPDFATIARQFFHRQEFDLLDSTSPSHQRDLFRKLWTIKEAYCKATGLGLALPLHDFAVLPAALAGPIATLRRAPHWTLLQFDCVPNSSCSVAMKTELPNTGLPNTELPNTELPNCVAVQQISGMTSDPFHRSPIRAEHIHAWHLWTHGSARSN